MKKNYIVPQTELETIHITYSMLSTSDSAPKAVLYDDDAEVEDYLNLGEATGDASITFAD